MAEAQKPKVTIKGTLGPQAATKVYIATPAYGGTFSGEYVRSLFMLLASRPKRPVEYVFSYHDYADIVTARNYLVSDFFFRYPDYSHILFVDDDMGFDAALVSEMIDLGEPVVGAICPKRRVDLRRLHAAKDVPFEKALARAVDFIGEIRKPEERRGDFVSVNYCGTGIMLISRSCIEKMIVKLPDLVDMRRFKRMPFGGMFTQFLTVFDKIKDGDHEWSEDISFCRRWVVDCGGKIWAHTNRTIRHTGPTVVSAKYSDLG